MSSHNNANIGLALGGGGVKGLAHIGLLKWLDRNKTRPGTISGTSMGAILGALYASGLSGDEIESRVREHIVSAGEPVKEIYRKRGNLLKWTKVFSFEKARGGMVAADGLFEHLFSELIDIRFEDLEIPFVAVATDFYSGREVVLHSGPLLPAIRASMAVPGVFAPVTIDDQLLVDGGLVNNLPTSHIRNCRIKIASDVIGLTRIENPKPLDVINGGISIMLCHSTRRALEQHPVDLLIKPDTEGIKAFDFPKIEETLKRGEEAIVGLNFDPLTDSPRKT